jgi:uncharacterized protein (TIGR02588 family)
MASRKKAPARKQPPKPPLLEWTTAGLGLLIVMAAFGLVGVQALDQRDRPPDLRLSAGEARRTGAGWILEVEASNRGDETAADVQIEGRLGAETATVDLDYVPAHGEAMASLRFDRDPGDEVKLVVLGWAEP